RALDPAIRPPAHRCAPSTSSPIIAGMYVTRLSRLCGEVFPGQTDDVDFFGCWLVGARCLKSCDDEDPAELGGHVGGRGLGLGGVPGSAGTVIFHVGWVVAGGGVPAGGDGLAGELERDRALALVQRRAMPRQTCLNGS